MIRHLFRALRRRLAPQDGIVLLYALGAMTVVLALSGAAVAAVSLDTAGTASDTNEKQAYAAAQAGIQRYLYELNVDSSYWSQCVPASQVQVPSTEWIYNTGQAEAHPQAVPGSSTETYAVMLLPAANQKVYSQCVSTNAAASMITETGTGTGTLRVASTGFAGNAKRTVVAAIRQQNFIDYAYFTVYETSDPSVQVAQAFSATSDQDTAIETPTQCAAEGANAPSDCGGLYWTAVDGGTVNGTKYPGAANQCDEFRSAGRQNQPFFVNSYDNGSRTLDADCSEIEFVTGDQINGPFHSDDSVLICGTPSFGQQGYNDSVEFGGDKTYPSGWTSACGGSRPTIHGTLTPEGGDLNMPAKNSLSSVPGAALYTGTTCVDLTTSGIRIAHPTTQNPSCFGSGQTDNIKPLNPNLAVTTIPYPASGVLDVSNSSATGCSTPYDVDDPDYFDPTTYGCGTVYVEGEDAQPLTIGADNDIVISGNLTYEPSSGAMLGLIATNFIRVYHPVSGGVCSATNNASNASGSLNDVTIDAAMLSLKHSFIVDDYECGASLGHLNVTGAIAQNYRGVVGTGSDGSNTGYIKNYVYDRRMQYQEPPHFLPPANGAYGIEHQTECDTASCDGTS